MSFTKEDIKAINGRLDEAMRVRMEVERRQYDRKGELEKALRETLYAEFGAEMEAAQSAERKLRDELREASDAFALENVTPPHPEGTVLVEWNPPHWSTNACRPTGRKGVVQVYRAGDPLPLNARWSVPRVGDVVIRELKKDGTPAKAVVAVWRDGSKMEDYWLPEGQKPGWAKA